ncbi:MAG TPA: metallophosphoesterase family protein [Thermomicrobiales bacterium]|nr:metallophosphoesterase family protein [Thermomicrobiales bacterium]
MTTIAFVSDIHGNLPALQAVLADLDAHGPYDEVVGGGDFVSGGAYPERVMAIVRERGWPSVRGNGDEWVIESASAGRVPARGYEQLPPPTMMQVQDWAAKALSQESLRYLLDLPLAWRTTGPSGKRLVFVHATPGSAHPIVMPDADESVLTAMLDQADTDTLVYGHIHRAYLRQVGERTVACCGAVGFPLDGDPRPCYLTATDTGSGWSLEHHRVNYDRDQYLSDLARSGIPNAAALIEQIRAGGASG